MANRTYFGMHASESYYQNYNMFSIVIATIDLGTVFFSPLLGHSLLIGGDIFPGLHFPFLSRIGKPINRTAGYWYRYIWHAKLYHLTSNPVRYWFSSSTVSSCPNDLTFFLLLLLLLPSARSLLYSFSQILHCLLDAHVII